MRLPDELFESIVGFSNLQFEKGKGVERRSLDRVRASARMHVIPLSKSMAARPISAQVRDISQDGIGLLLPQKLTIGESLLVRLPANDSSVWVFCQIARVERVATGLYITGATFQRFVEQNAAAHRLQTLLPTG